MVDMPSVTFRFISMFTIGSPVLVGCMEVGGIPKMTRNRELGEGMRGIRYESTGRNGRQDDSEKTHSPDQDPQDEPVEMARYDRDMVDEIGGFGDWCNIEVEVEDE